MKEFDEKSKAKRIALAGSNEKDNVEIIGPCAPVLNQCINHKNIQTLIREIDAKKHELRAVKDKHTETWQWIYINARNFFCEGTGAGTLK